MSQAYEEYLAEQREYERLLGAVDAMPALPESSTGNAADFLLAVVGRLEDEAGAPPSTDTVLRISDDCVRRGMKTGTGLEIKGRPNTFSSGFLFIVARDVVEAGLLETQNRWQLTEAGRKVVDGLFAQSVQL